MAIKMYRIKTPAKNPDGTPILDEGNKQLWVYIAWGGFIQPNPIQPIKVDCYAGFFQDTKITFAGSEMRIPATTHPYLAVTWPEKDESVMQLVRRFAPEAVWAVTTFKRVKRLVGKRTGRVRVEEV